MLVPGFGVVAAGPDVRAARRGLEIAAHTHASVAATLDRFGGASWLTDAEVHDFEYWPLELYKLTLAPPPPELAGHVVLVTGAASGIGRDIAHDLRPAARTSSSPTSTRTVSPAPPTGSRAVTVAAI